MKIIPLVIAFTMSAIALFTPQVSASAVPGNYGFFAQTTRNCSQGIDKTNCKITEYIITFINILSAAVGIVVTIMIVWGGIQYTTSRDNPQQTAAAKEHIRNAIFALVFYIFSIALLNWLIPGGLYN